MRTLLGFSKGLRDKMSHYVNSTVLKLFVAKFNEIYGRELNQ